MDPLLQYGAIGAVLLWFMLRNEKKTEALTIAINNNNKIMIYLIDVVSGCPNNPYSRSSGPGGEVRKDTISKLKEEIIKS